MQGQADQQLVEERGDGKHERAGPDARDAGAQGREVHVAQHPLVHRHVPQAPVVADVRRVPPVLRGKRAALSMNINFKFAGPSAAAVPQRLCGSYSASVSNIYIKT